MNGTNFLRIVEVAFAPFLERLGFVMDEPSISGRSYRVSFVSSTHAVLVSFEPGDEARFVMVFSRTDGNRSDIDDRAVTPRLADLNSRYMSAVTCEERARNEEIFRPVVANDNEERLLLKAAKELSLVLPKYLSQLPSMSRPTAQHPIRSADIPFWIES